MHRGRDFFRSCARWALILACVGCDAHAAQLLPSRYGALVPVTDGQQAAQDASTTAGAADALRARVTAAAHGERDYHYQCGP
jgi:hypothetical protein